MVQAYGMMTMAARYGQLKQKMKHKFKILSIDGGGIRGIIPCSILNLIEIENGPIAKNFNLIAGTSTGGIIALALAKPNPLSARQIHKLYEEKGSLIFTNRQRKGIFSRVGSMLSKKIKTITNHPYDSEGIEKLLSDIYGDAMLSDCKTNTIITSYDIVKSEAFYFISRLKEAEAFLIKDVARATSAAPTYFEHKVIEREDKETLTLVDGGVFANNPSVLAFAEAKYLQGHGTKVYSTSDDLKPLAISDDELPFLFVSIGTGTFKRAIDLSDLKTTGAWIKPLVEDIFMESVSQNTHFLMKQLLPDFSDGTPRYIRINLEIPEKNMEMDDVSEGNIKAINKLTEDYMNSNPAELELLLNLLN